MTKRFRWLSAAVGVSVILSLLLVGFVGSARAAGAKHSTAKHTTAAKKRCAKRNKATGTVKYSDWQFPTSLSGYQTTAAVAALTEDIMFDGLDRYNNKAKLFPMVLTKLPSTKNGGISADGKTVTMTFKKGLMWSNKTEITAKDLQFGFKVDSDKLTGPACQGSCDIISRIDTKGKYTAILHLKKPYGPLLCCALPDFWPSKWSNSAGSWNNDAHKAAQTFEDPTFNFEDSSYPTNGPYQVTEFVKNNRITLHPASFYNNMTCGGLVSNMIFAFYADKNSMIAAAANHETDVTQNYTIFDVPTLAKNAGAYKIYNDPGFVIEHLELNVDKTYHGSNNPIADRNVRLALALSLDKLGLIESALSVSASAAKSIAAYTPLVVTKKLVQPFADKALTGQWDPLAKKGKGAYVTPGVGTALADAKKLLAKTPFASGFTVDYDTTSGNPVRAAAVGVATQNWARLNIKVNPVFVPAGKFFSDWDTGSPLNHGDFQIAEFAFSGGPDPDPFKANLKGNYIDRQHPTHSTTYANYSGVNDPVINKGFDAAAYTLDNKVRFANYKKVQDRINQYAYWIPLYYRTAVATADNKVKGVLNTPAGEITWNAGFGWRSAAGS